MGNLQLVELLSHQPGGTVFPEARLRMGKSLLSDRYDLFLPLVDGLTGKSLQLFDSQHNQAPLKVSSLARLRMYFR